MKNILFGLIATLLISITSFGQNESRILPVLGLQFSVSADLVSIDGGGCFTVNIRVYMIDQSGNSLLIASGNSHVCGNRPASPNSTSESTTCEDTLFKGDYITHQNSKDFKYCLIDCLKDERVYEKYETEKYKVLSSIKK